MTKRKYTPRKRAAQQEETRRKIVAAAMHLHEELGPRDTTIKAVADRAGVQRLTVYRHFPDESSLFEACTSHWLDLHPMPGPADWPADAKPVPRAEAAFRAYYAYYRGTQRMWTRAYQDGPEVPALQPKMAEVAEYLGSIRDDLARGFGGRKGASGAVRAVIGHGLQFSTWQSLEREGLSDDEKSALMARWLESLASA